MKESEMFRANKILEANKSKLERKKKRTEKKKIEPCGNILPRKDIFKFRSENLGVFKRPKIERNKSI